MSRISLFVALILVCAEFASARKPSKPAFVVEARGSNESLALTSKEQRHLERALGQMLASCAIDLSKRINKDPSKLRPIRWPIAAEVPVVRVRYPNVQKRKAHRGRKTLEIKELVFVRYHGIYAKGPKGVWLLSKYSPRSYAAFVSSKTRLRSLAPFASDARRFDKDWKRAQKMLRERR